MGCFTSEKLSNNNSAVAHHILFKKVDYNGHHVVQYVHLLRGHRIHHSIGIREQGQLSFSNLQSLFLRGLRAVIYCPFINERLDPELQES